MQHGTWKEHGRGGGWESGLCWPGGLRASGNQLRRSWAFPGIAQGRWDSPNSLLFLSTGPGEPALASRWWRTPASRSHRSQTICTQHGLCLRLVRQNAGWPRELAARPDFTRISDARGTLGQMWRCNRYCTLCGRLTSSLMYELDEAGVRGLPLSPSIKRGSTG